MSTRESVCGAIARHKFIVVIRTGDAGEVAGMVAAAAKAGAQLLEITLTVPRALRCLEAAADKYGDRIILGAGTVLDAAACHDAVQAGARFIVSPHGDRAIVAAARRHGAVAIPGALTATEVLAAWEQGADYVKIFPCEAVGGAAYLRALQGPLPQVRMMPTGAATPRMAAAYLQAGAAALGSGGGLFTAREDGWAAGRAAIRRIAATISAAGRARA